MRNRLYKFLLPIVGLLTLPAVSWATLVTSPAPPGVSSYKDYQVKVNGKSLFVYGSGLAVFSHFSTDEAVQVEIAAAVKINWVDIRPKSLGIKPVLKNNVSSFQLPKPYKDTRQITFNTKEVAGKGKEYFSGKMQTFSHESKIALEPWASKVYVYWK